MPDRTSGLELCRAFYEQCVAPAIEALHPGLPHAAGLMGRGSEVLGYDDEMSTDHTWLARVTVFVSPETLSGEPPLESRLAKAIPARFRDLPTEVDVTTVRQYFLDQLGLDTTETWDAYDWISLAQQRLCAMTAGAVFHDDLDLTEVRGRLAYYPRDVWLYLLHAGWWRVHPELNLVGRAGYAGDELGSRVIAHDMVAGLMHLAFLIERRYPPYAKWYGTAFARLTIGEQLTPLLEAALSATRWPEREEALARAYEVVGGAFNDLGLAPSLRLEPVRMWDRPFTVMWADFPGVLAGLISDPAVLDLLARWPTGDIDRVRDVLWKPEWRTKVRDLAKPLAPAQPDRADE